MKSFIIAVFAALLMTSGAAYALNFDENFSAPAAIHIQGPGDLGRFVFAPGKMTAEYDSLADPVRGYMPLGATLTQADSFEFGGIVKILSADFQASFFGNFQIAFGLVNEEGDAKNQTGLKRSVPYGESADVYNNLEIDYFPNAFYGFGPNFGVSMFGPAANAGEDAFVNFQSPEYDKFQLGDQSGESDLPKDVRLNIYGRYDAGTKLMTYGVKEWTGSAWLPLVLYVDPTTQTQYTEVTFDPFLYRSDWNQGINGFNVDSFAVSLYKDPFDDGQLYDGLQSLKANVEFYDIYCRTAGEAPVVPEPASIVLVLCGLGALAAGLRGKI
jgi:hypothetical protein